MSVVLEMVNFTRLRLVKFISISNTTLMVFIPNFTATHAITSTNPFVVRLNPFVVRLNPFVAVCTLDGFPLQVLKGAGYSQVIEC